MATTTTKPNLPSTSQFSARDVPAWPQTSAVGHPDAADSSQRASGRDALQALLAFAALHEQVRRRKALAVQRVGFDGDGPEARKSAVPPEFEADERFVLDEVLQLVAERAVAITGADGLAIALAENNEIVLRAAAGRIRPDIGARIDRSSAFSGACFRMAQTVRCDDTELDPRVNLRACRLLGTRSMVAVPLCGRRRVIGLLEAFSAEPFGFNDSDVSNLSLLAELILAALKPEDEDRFADSAQAAASEFDSAASGKGDSSLHLTAETQAQAQPVSPALTSFEPEKVQAESASASRLLAPPVARSGFDETRLAETKFDKTKLDEKKLAETKLAETKLAETKFGETKFGETKFGETRLDETTVAPTRKTAETDTVPATTTASHRPGVLVVLISVVVASMLAGGIWWKLKNAQLGSSMLQTQTPETQAQQTQNLPTQKPASSSTAGAKPALPESGSPKSSPDTATPDALRGSAESTTTPATVQELAKFPHVSGIRHWSSADSSTVVLDLEDQVQYEAHRLSSPDRIYFDLRDTALPPELFGKNIEVGDALLSRIRVAQPVPGLTRVVLETKGNSNFAVSLEPNPYRLVVQVTKVGTSPKGSVNLFPNEVEVANRLAIVVPPPTKEDLQLRAHVPRMRIVVDPGHGGWDLGTVGRRGLLEKDLVLEIAQRLGKLLESRLGSEVIYTRQDDNYVPLDERAGIANQVQADLFISVHANYSDLPSARGVETYYTNFFSSANSKDIEARENGSKTPVIGGLSSVELHGRIEQSRRLATSVQRALYATLSASNPGLRNRGIKEAGFVVLTETSMPGILAEVSFVSSPSDEQRLRSDGYREQIAEALYKGIARYAVNSRGVKLASVGASTESRVPSTEKTGKGTTSAHSLP
jgi:N-acetylmuramoyl-L-alanine amidase/putative methionine-R-sulfoxide reductase with GAF domain